MKRKKKIINKTSIFLSLFFYMVVVLERVAASKAMVVLSILFLFFSIWESMKRRWMLLVCGCGSICNFLIRGGNKMGEDKRGMHRKAHSSRK